MKVHIQPAFYILLIGALSVIFSSCSGDKKVQNVEIVDTLKIDGSSTVFPITSKIVELYNNQFGDLKISVNVSGTGGGFSKFALGEIDLNNASREINEVERQRCQDNEVIYEQIRIAIDGIAVVVNPKNTWIDYLTVAELKLIWQKDGAKKWSEVRAAWPAEPIELYSPGEASGTYDYFKEAILGSVELAEEVKMSENDNLLALGVSNSKNAIGFFALAYFEDNKSKLKLVPIDNGQGPVFPTAETVGAGEYTPLSRPVFIYVRNQFKEKAIGKKFLQFYLNKAPATAQSLGFVPLETAEYAKTLASLSK